MTSDSDDQAVEVLLRFARAAHEAGGYPANELEPRIIELSRALGLPEVQVVATPTSVELSVGAIPFQRVYVLRVRPRPVDLYAIDQLEKIADAVAGGRLDCPRALNAIDELGQHPLRRPVGLIVAAYAIVGAGLAPILGGGWHESIAGGAVAMVVGVLTRVVMRGERFIALVAPTGGCLASFLASAIAIAGFPIAVRIATIAALVILLPAMPMAIGMRELATHHLQAGIANSVNALVQFVGLVFGVAVGRSLATSWFGAIPLIMPEPLPPAVSMAAAALVGLGFVVTLRAPARDAIWTSSAAVLAVVVHRIATPALGDIAGVFAAAFVIGVAGNAVARRFRRSPLSFIVPGSLLLVPGSIGYESATSLLSGRTVTGIDTAVATLATLLAIAYGLVAATLVLPDQPAVSVRN